jgi:serine phosphatase RsbU (regulator of sigma subunit)
VGTECERLRALVVRQQAELDAARDRRSATTIRTLATGILVERLGCSPADATEQLELLAEQVGMTTVEFASEVVGETAGHRTVAAAPPVARRRIRLAEAAVSAAADGDEVAAALLADALAATGASSVMLWTVEPDGALDLAGATNLATLDASRWRRIPPQFPCLQREVLVTGRPLWWPRGAPADSIVPLVGPSSAARVVLPMHNADAVMGVLEVRWPEALDQLAEPLRQQLLAAAEVAVHGLGRHHGASWDGRAAWLPALLDALTDAVLLARALRDGDGRVVDFEVEHVTERFVDPAGRPRDTLLGRRLLDLYPLAAAPGGLIHPLVRAHATGEPFHAPRLALDVVVDGAARAVDVEVRATRLFDGVAVSCQIAAATDRLTALFQQAEQLGQVGGWEQDLPSGRVLWTDHTFAVFHLDPASPAISLDHLDRNVFPEDLPAFEQFRETLLHRGKPAVAVFRIMRSDDAVRYIRAFGEPVAGPDGSPVALRGAYQDLSASYHTQVAFAATREQLAETEQRASDSERLALRLQHAIMAASATLPRAAGLDIAVRYRSSEQDHLVSGDWYNAILLPGGDVLLIIGDIAGHGIEAVTGMVNLRYSLRGLAITGAGPGRLLSWLNNVAYHLTDNITGTVICGRYTPATRSFRWARAGHLPPVLIRDGTARTLAPPDGPLLGALMDADYDETTTTLRDGDRLLLFTDGLIERRGTSLDDALDALLRLAAHPAADIQDFADHLLRHTSPDTDDDTCLIAVHIR